MTRLRLKTRVLAGIVVLANVVGNFCLSSGLRHRNLVTAGSPAAWLEALTSPWVFLGVAVLAFWMLSRLALLSWADLSWVVPVTGVGYVLNALAGRVFLGEQISLARWGGILLITAGVLLVRTTAIRTTQPERPREKRR